MADLSKSKLQAYRQCSKRLWLSVRRPDLQNADAGNTHQQDEGNSVGTIARKIYDPQGVGVLIDTCVDGIDEALHKTERSLKSRATIFEAGLRGGGGLFFADVLRPDIAEGSDGWEIIEVKSATSVNDYYIDDVAVQYFVASAAGVAVSSMKIAHVDSNWTLERPGVYSGLLKEIDVFELAVTRSAEVASWISEAQHILQLPAHPIQSRGSHCTTPVDCSFSDYCRSKEPEARFPIDWLPRSGRKINDAAQRLNVTDMTDLPDAVLNDTQRLVRHHSLANTTFF